MDDNFLSALRQERVKMLREYISVNAPDSRSVLPNASDEEIEEMYNTIIDIKLMMIKKNLPYL